jgi:hypothetical protein
VFCVWAAVEVWVHGGWEGGESAVVSVAGVPEVREAVVSLVGRTIVGVSESLYGDVLELRLDDGSLAVLTAHSYEDADISVEILDREAQNARARLRVGDQHREWLRRLQTLGRVAAEKRIREKAKAELSPGGVQGVAGEPAMDDGQVGLLDPAGLALGDQGRDGRDVDLVRAADLWAARGSSGDDPGPGVVQRLHSCWLATFSDKPCQGPMDRAHLIAKQRLKREVSGDPRLVWHPSLWVWACRRHHGDFDNRVLRVGRGDLPVGLEGAAEILGLGWMLDADYGPLDAAA